MIFPDHMTQREKAISGALALALLLVGSLAAGAIIAADSGDVETDPTMDMEPSDSEYVNRFVDREAGVVCYVFDREGAAASGAGWKNGISCLPLNQTRLS